MKTYNHQYTTHTAFVDFLSKYHIEDNDQLLIQVFTGKSSIDSIQSLQRVLQTYFSEASVIGATADGQICNAQNTAITSTTFSFTQFDNTQLKSALVEYQNAFQGGQALSQAISQPDNKAIICFADGLHTNGEAFIDGLTSVASGVVISGGLAGDNGFLKQTIVFTLTDMTTNGAVGVSLSNPELQVSTSYSFDWCAVGRKMHVTRSEGNVVYEIDHQPAQSVYRRYLGDEVANRLPMTGIEFPLVKNEDGIHIGRAVTGAFDRGALSFAGNLREQDVVQFGIGSNEAIFNGACTITEGLINRPVESLFIYSCMARRRFLGSNADSELQPFKMCQSTAGFYTYGEFYYCQTSRKSHLLNQTMTVLALSESPSSRVKFAMQTERNHPDVATNQIDTLAAVSHLAYTMSNDFERLNAMLAQQVEMKSLEMVHRNLIDEPTGLPNRQSLLDDLKHSSHDEILIVININDFSKVNGFYGLDAGDELLYKVSNKLKHKIHEHQYGLINPKLYKLPSDEYAILAHITNDQSLQHCLKLLNKEVFEQTYRILGFDILVHATWVYSEVNGSEQGLIQAELVSKEARIDKQNFVRYDMQKFVDTHQKLELAKRVRRAILADGLYPVYHPIYDNKTGKLAKYECLARLKDEQGIMSPMEFLSIAKMIHLYPLVTEIMIHKSFKAFQGTGLNFSVNLSLEDIQSESAQTMIFYAMEYYGVSNQVTFEILENQALEEDDAIFKFIAKVKRMGARIAIDDFGSGYANYEHLAKLQADIIKIDGSLIKKLEYDHVANAVVESMLTFTRKLNTKVVAEFVSSEAIFKHVCGEGIDYSQGFYLSEPLEELPTNEEQSSSKGNQDDFPFFFY